MNSPIGLQLSMSGYAAIAFVHDGGTFSVTFTHDGTDTRLRRLREDVVFEAAVRAIPRLSDWIEPGRSHPLTPCCPVAGCTTATARSSAPAARRSCPG